jgi:AraC-like DNA-binding protein
VDVLSEVLDVTGVRGSAGARIAAGGEWGVEWLRDRDAVVYAVTAGVAWLTLDGAAPRLLMTGDVVILATGAAHSLSSEPGVDIHSCDVAAAATARRQGGVLRLGDGDVQTHVLGASYSHDPAGSTPVFSLLPPVVHLGAQQIDPTLNDVVRLLGREIAHPGLATDLLLDRLVDVLLVEVLRTWLASSPLVDASWWGVLRDPLLLRAVTRLHEAPGYPWTTEALAREVATSKQTLVRRFATFAGTTPGAYLARWRMDLAAHRLRDTDDTLAEIAADVGYTSVYAFSRAFSRERSLPPGRYRTASRVGGPASDHDG